MKHIMLKEADIMYAIGEAVLGGAALVKGIIKPNHLLELNREVAKGPYRPASEATPNVTQRFDRYAYMHEAPGMSLLTQLQKETQYLIQRNRAMFPPLGEWQAIDVVVQRYQKDGILTAHRDLSRHPYIIASYTIAGACQFDVLETRSGPIRKVLFPEAGDLLLLLAPGLVPNCLIDERPFHQLSGALTDEPRVAVTFRHNLQTEKPIDGFGYLNHP